MNKHYYISAASDAAIGTVRPGLLGGATVSWYRRVAHGPFGRGSWSKFAESKA